MKGFLIFCGLLIGLYIFWESWEISRPAGVLAPDEPYQGDLYTSSVREKNGYRITPLASFDMRARVIAAARYRFGAGADLSPVDLVLGWGTMSDSDVLSKISFSQGGRAYTWWTRTFPIPRRAIETHGANMHMIPAMPLSNASSSRSALATWFISKDFSSRSLPRRVGAGEARSRERIPAAALASLSWWSRSMSGDLRMFAISRLNS